MTVPLANVITFAARDFAAQKAFYRRLGWPQVVDFDDFAAFELRGAVLALFPAERLAQDARAEPAPAHDGIGFSFGIMAETPQEVDQVMELAAAAGARISKPAQDAEAFTGRSGYFADPEGNYWEVAWAPPENPVISAARRAAGSG